ncbi:MAG: LTA synthase family protein [Acidobacteria bacterium]|nr:LTA synthase family protein [Acidobacteriota bacterium]
MSAAEVRPRLLLYPFLFSLYPVLHLYLRNIREVSWAQALWAAIAALGIGFAAWPLTRLVSARLEKRALALFLFLVLFHFYGLYYGEIAGLLPPDLAPPAAHALALFFPVAAWTLLAVALSRSRSSFSAANRILGVAVLALLAWNAAGIIAHVAGSLAAASGGGEPISPPARTAAVVLPDIYCFILDEYASPASAQRLFGYDPVPFVDGLRRRSFAVAEKSRARFAMTEPAIADILNLGRLPGNADPAKAVRRSQVVAMLKNRGYRVVDFACMEHLFLEAADRRIHYDLSRASIFFDDFYRALFERSLLRVLPDMWQRRETDLLPYYRQRVLQVFAELPAIAAEPGPKFVFVHLLSPHEPFVFTADGGSADPGLIWDHSDPSRYLAQYEYVNRRMLETVDAILERSRRPPVILLQSDHGYRGSRRQGNRVPPAEKLSVLNALHLPGAPPETVVASLSPRNNFRLVFNLYFGGGYPLLPNS